LTNFENLHKCYELNSNPLHSAAPQSPTAQGLSREQSALGQIAYEVYYRALGIAGSSPFYELSPARKLAWTRAAMAVRDAVRKEAENQKT
jgi:hypothetical protein